MSQIEYKYSSVRLSIEVYENDFPFFIIKQYKLVHTGVCCIFVNTAVKLSSALLVPGWVTSRKFRSESVFPHYTYPIFKKKTLQFHQHG